MHAPKPAGSLVDCSPVGPQSPKGNELSLKQVVQVNICGKGTKNHIFTYIAEQILLRMQERRQEEQVASGD